MCKHLNLELFGAPKISVNNKRIFFRSKRGIALITYLHLENKPVARKDLAKLLWPSHEQPATDKIRVLLYSIRKHFPNLIVSLKDSLTLNEAVSVSSDVNRFLTLYNENSIDAYQDAIRIYSSDFLADNSFEASKKYDTWLEEQQTSLRGKLDKMYVETIEFLLIHGKRSNDNKEAKLLKQQYNSLFPWSDTMIKQLSLVYIKQNQLDEALELLIGYERHLQEELSLDLSHELSMFKNNLTSGELEFFRT